MRFRGLYEHLRSSYWYLPSLMAAGAALLALVLVALDRVLQGYVPVDGFWILPAGAEGARAILATVASSMITVTGVVFSITVVTLSLAAQQFGPRLLQNFMRDRGNQAVLGTGTATFLYCLLVLRTVAQEPGRGFVPHLSLAAAVGLGVLCVGALIYFIHHVAETIQVTHVVARIGDDLVEALNRLFPDAAADTDANTETGALLADDIPGAFDADAAPVPALRSGYVQSLDLEGLVALAESRDLFFRVQYRPGQFVVAGEGVTRVWPGAAARDTELGGAVNRCFTLGPRRTPEQDPHFLVDELVEIGVRALSPGVNDPFTAMACVDRLTAALCHLAPRRRPDVRRRDPSGRVRVIATSTDFCILADAAFAPLREHGRTDSAVTLHILESLRRIAPATRDREQRLVLLRHAEWIEEASRDALPTEADRQAVRDRCRTVREALREDLFAPTEDG